MDAPDCLLKSVSIALVKIAELLGRPAFHFVVDGHHKSATLGFAEFD
jgi:hypothetical protein